MASIADNSTALKVMSDANKDFLSLIMNLRAFLGGQDPVTFTVGNQEITVNSLLKIIDDYRNGNFNEIILGGQDSDTRIKLSVNANGDLSITDSKGNLAVISCEKLSTSILDNCTCNEVTANGATIGWAEGSVRVRGGDFSFSKLKLNNLDVGVLDANGISVKDVSVSGRVSCSEMFITGTRKFVPQNVRNVFYRNGAPLDNAASLLKIENSQWDMSDGLTPADFGFVTYSGSRTAGSIVPDLIKICGNNKYSDFTSSRFFLHYIMNPDNVDAYVADNGSTSFSEVELTSGSYPMAALMMWPTGLYAPSIQKLNLCSFATSDIGKEIYYQVLENSWKIYRTMTLYYSSASDRIPNTVVFDNMVDLPAYSCRRFIANCHTITEGTGKKVVYALE